MLFADWAEQSQRTKTDLLTHGEEGKDYIRITHTGDWQLRVRNELASPRFLTHEGAASLLPPNLFRKD